MSHEANNAGAESGVLSASNTEGEAANAAATHRASPEPIVDELEEWEKVEAPAQVVAPIADLTPARQLHAAGFKLCALHPNSKRPVGLAWNNPANCVSTFDESLTGYGFPLNINGRCSIDPDEVTMAKVTIAAWGFDLDEIMAAGVRTNSTRPGSGGRSQFTTVDGLGWVTFRTKVDGKNVTVLELRASSDNLQDVIPGLLYADITGAIRTQAYANGKTFLDAPPPPADFTAFWKRMSSDMAFRAQMEDKANAALREAGYTIDLIRDLSGTGAGNLPFGDVDKRLRAKFNAASDVEAILLKHGYTRYRNHRWSSPNSTGEPGIRLIKGHDTLWQSSHGSDPLRGTFDAAAASIVLDFAYDEDAFEAYVRASAAKLDFADDVGAGNSGPTVEEVAAAVAEVAWAEVEAELGAAEEEWATPVGLEAIEYTLDGFLSAGVTYIAGGHGIGKSSLLVPLASIVSGELPTFEQSISAMLQRKVVYITEDPNQARRIRYGLKKHNGLVENGHFRIVGAKRRSAGEVELMMDATVKAHTITGPHGYLVKPLIVFDTTNACFEIDNENDAAEVGRVMSALKQSGAPVWIIGHLAKAIARNDIAAMTGRGSGAWEADAQGTAFIFAEDEATDVRYLATKKRRFEPSYIEVKYITHIDHEVVVAPWGEEQCIGFRYGMPERACSGQRIEEAAKRRLEADLNEVVRYLAATGIPMSKSDVEANSGVPRNRTRVALAEGVRRGTLGQDGQYAIGNNRQRHGGYYIRVAEFG